MSSGFITETEIAETRKKRQEEWEKVRKADDPLEVPEQPYDSRSLYDRLQEQKQRKELEYEEAHKLKNMIKGLDDDEVEFLDLVDRTKLAADRKINLEEEKELNDYRNRVATLQQQSQDKKLQTEINKTKLKTVANNRTSLTKVLKGVIVTKRRRGSSSGSEGTMENTDEPAKKAKLEKNDTNGHSESKNVRDQTENDGDKTKNKEKPADSKATHTNTGLTCVGVLPGLGYYDESSSDECSSNSDQEAPIIDARLDLLGRRIIKKTKETLNSTDLHLLRKRKFH